jgi:hypothetical protein
MCPKWIFQIYIMSPFWHWIAALGSLSYVMLKKTMEYDRYIPKLWIVYDCFVPFLVWLHASNHAAMAFLNKMIKRWPRPTPWIFGHDISRFSSCVTYTEQIQFVQKCHIPDIWSCEPEARMTVWYILYIRYVPGICRTRLHIPYVCHLCTKHIIDQAYPKIPGISGSISVIYQQSSFTFDMSGGFGIYQVV